MRRFAALLWRVTPVLSLFICILVDAFRLVVHSLLTSPFWPLRFRIPALRPIRPIEAAVLDGFGDVLGLEVCDVFQIGNRAGNFEDAVVGAGA